MKIYETGRLIAEPFLPPLYAQVRARLRKLTQTAARNPQILDVGGRKSPYTIGLRAHITVLDLPRESELQEQLNLGINRALINEIKRRRSNIETVLLGDMTHSDLPDESFDLAVAVEVLEHVEEDEQFVSEVSRVLKPGGIFLMTTPNGDWLVNKNPDHKRHYHKKHLAELLNKHFADVTIEYAIAGGRYRKMGLKAWSIQRPIQTANSIFGNIVNSFQSANKNIKSQSQAAHHLIAIAAKKFGREIY